MVKLLLLGEMSISHVFLKQHKSIDRSNKSPEVTGSVAEMGLEIDTNCCDSKEWKIKSHYLMPVLSMVLRSH